MGWDLIKNSLVFILIVIGFILLLLLPREMQMTQVTSTGGTFYEYEYPFTFDLFKENIQGFIQHFQSENGFGENKYGVAVAEEVKKSMKRDFYIIIPAFTISIFMGILLGILQFNYRERLFGKVQTFLSWILSSVPDFFFFIACQYLLIKLFHTELIPRFSLYGNDHWYNFIIPMLALSLFPLVYMIKFTAASLESEMGRDYIRTARSKGLLTMGELKHMLWNCLPSILNQTQFVMLYILSSLPIIEKLSSYQGAGYHLLASIQSNEDPRALAFMLPYLFLMFATVIFSKIVNLRFVPQKSGELK